MRILNSPPPRRSRLPAGVCVAVLSAATLAPAGAFACGGLFCNNSQPIEQQAENILFVPDGEQTHMHVRISYVGPPQNFGWLLPVPRGVETRVGSEAVFQALGAFAPQFVLNWEYTAECMELDYPEYADGAAAGGAGGEAPGRGVEVLSREPVGPYDRAILDARTVEDLRLWLTDNGYQIPDAVDATLRPYIDQNAVFVAVKLLPGQQTGDLVPLMLSYPGNAPTIPIVPTAVATRPDLGIVAQVLGDARAIPLNYRHVQINEAAIDWLSGGGNYFDVVAQASDEAGGRAFATDFAGPHGLRGANLLQISDEVLDRLAAAHTVAELAAPVCEIGFGDPDLRRVLTSIFKPPGDSEGTFLDCVGQVGNDPAEAVDGAAIAERLRLEVNDAHATADAQIAAHPYLTRLFTTMSADEMTEDPTFAFNADAAAVSNVHEATAQVYQCDADGYYDRQNLRIVTASGLVLAVVDGGQADAIQRQDGETIRKGEEPGAAVIEQYLVAGEPTTDLDNVPAIQARNDGSNVPRGTPNADDGGCDCRTSGSANAAPWALLGLAGLAGRRRRRR